MKISATQVLAWVPLIGVVSGLLGVLLGSYLTRSWQKKQSLMESKKAEYRELISVLSQSAHFILNNAPLQSPGGVNLKTGEQQRLSDEAEERGHTTIADRIFISDAVTRERIAERWNAVLCQKEVGKFWSAWQDLHRVLLKMAREGLNL